MGQAWEAVRPQIQADHQGKEERKWGREGRLGVSILDFYQSYGTFRKAIRESMRQSHLSEEPSFSKEEARLSIPAGWEALAGGRSQETWLEPSLQTDFRQQQTGPLVN